MKKVIIVMAAFICFSGHLSAQGVSSVLEQSLSAVVTVGIYKTQKFIVPRGYRGGEIRISDLAYQKALDLSGAAGAGSGFVILKNEKKYIVTNAHVVGNAAEESGSIYVFSISRKKYEVRVLGGDSFYDLAVLEFVDTPGPEITAMEFKLDEPRIGESVYAIGNPLGEFPYSVVDGIISAKNRVREGMIGKFGFLQTTATIIWGNSGGPLVDASGKVAGINSQLYFTYSPGGENPLIQPQINFALEAKLAMKLVNDIIQNKGLVTRAYLGLEISQKKMYNPRNRTAYSEDATDPLPVISGVIENSPAASKCYQYVGAVVTKINSSEVAGMEEVLAELESLKPLANVEIEVLTTGNVRKTISFTASKLGENELRQIGEFVLKKNDQIVVDMNAPVVTFAMKEDNYYRYQENRYKQYGSGPGNRKFIVLGAGVVESDASSLWRVENYKDLGAAVRLSGLQGVIDFAVVPERNTSEDPQICRLYLSKDENINKQTIWY